MQLMLPKELLYMYSGGGDAKPRSTTTKLDTSARAAVSSVTAASCAIVADWEQQHDHSKRRF